MKILLLSVTAGQGHHQTAKAISEYFQKRGHETVTLDCYEYLSPPIKEAISGGYLVSTKYVPKLWGKFYGLLEKYDEYDPIVKGANHLMSHSLLKYVDDCGADAIVCTHVFACMLMTYIKRKRPEIMSLGILTDFRLHPYFECTELDYYVIPNEYLEFSVCEKGIPKEKILPFGIPVMEKFMTKKGKETARDELNISHNKTILVMGGSMGFGNMTKTLKKIDNLELDFQIIVVCGNNKKLYKKINRTEFKHKIYNFGYVTNVDTLMDASDCIVTKPGGLTTSEALSKELPLILSKPIPGQEDRNSEFLLNFGCAMKISKTLSAEEIVYQFFSDDKKRENMVNNIQLIKKPNAVKDLYEFITNLNKNK